MNVSGVSNNALSQSIHQKQSAQRSQQTDRAVDQEKQDKVQSQKTAVQAENKRDAKDLAGVQKKGKAETAENQAHSAEKQKQSNDQLLKRMEAQATMHPAYIQVQQQQQAASKGEPSKEATKVAATTSANTGNR